MKLKLETRQRIISSMHIHRVWAQHEKELYSYYNISDGVVKPDGKVDNSIYLMTSRCITHFFKFLLFVFELQLAIKKYYENEYAEIFVNTELDDDAKKESYLLILRDARDFVTHSKKEFLDDRFWNMLKNPDFQKNTFLLFAAITQFIDKERTSAINDGGSPL